MIPNPWKVAFFLLAISPTTVACRGFAQQRNGSSDGLYAVPDAGKRASTGQKLASDGSVQSSLNSLDPHGEQFKRDMAKAEAEASAKKTQALADGDRAPWTMGLSESVWIAIIAGLGLSVSLAAVGYVWRARTLQARTGGPILLPVKQVPVSLPDSVGKQDPDKTVTRRAA